MWHRCQGAPAPPLRVLLDVSTPTSSPSSPHIHGQGSPGPLQYPAVAVILPPPDVSKPGSVHPQSHGLEPFGKALAGAGCDTLPSHPPIWFHCVPLWRNVPVLFPRRLLGKDGRNGPRQGQLSQRPQPWCHASHGHHPPSPSPSPPWAWRGPRGARGDVALTSGSWRPATTVEGRGRTSDAGQAPTEPGKPSAAPDLAGNCRDGPESQLGSGRARRSPQEGPASLAAPPGPQPGGPAKSKAG